MSTDTPTAGLIIIGNEILNAKVVDQNTPFLLGELRRLGVTVRRVVVIPDDREVIAAEVAAAHAAYDWVFTSGGLGPTHDDLTMEAVADAFGTELEQSAELKARLESLGDERRVRALMPLTWIPRGASLYASADDSYWPTVYIGNVFIFPGVPDFLRAKFVTLKELLTSRPFHSISVYCGGRESEIVDQIEATVSAFPDVDIGSYPQFGPVDHKTRLTFDSRDAARAERATEHFVSLLGEGGVVRVER